MTMPRRYAQSVTHPSRSRQSSSRTFAVQSGARGWGSGGGHSIGSGSGYGFSSGMGMGMGGGGSSSLMIGGGMGLIGDEKNAMQNLNDRLASYLSKVQQLEQSNKELEVEIRQFASSSHVEGFDWSVYDQTIPPLQAQIHQAIIQNSTIALEIDNAKLAAEDFQNKWQTEQGLRMSVESDIDGLHNLKATYLQLQENLTDDIAGLEDEIAFLKKNHEEELRMLRQHRSQDIQVEVDSEPGEDLEQVMAQLREQYAKMATENKAGMEKWYQDQLVIKQTTVVENTQALDGVRNELSQYRHQMQEMEMEYNSLLGSINALGNTLGQIEGSYEMQLQGLQTSLAQLEGDLGRIRQELMHQNGEYEKLLNIKMRLEAEIGQYRVLLSGGHQGSSSGFSSSISSGQNTSGGKVTITSVTESRQTVTK